MTSLARIRPSLRRAAFVAALGALLAPATAGAAVHAQASAKKKAVKLPVVSSVRPMKVEIGQTLEVRGKNFLRGRNKNSVVFKRDGGKAVFVKAGVGTTKLLRVKVPAKLQKEFTKQGTSVVPTRFRVRVLAKKFGKRFTTASRSPLISLPAAALPPGYVESLPDGDCDNDGTKNRADGDDDNDGLGDATEQSLNLNPCKADTDDDGVEDRFEFDCDRNGVLNRDEGDDDKDLLPDGQEQTIGTDPCSSDTDGDGVQDGYEYQSARDLNDDEHQQPNEYLPYPGKRPYPNPLDPSDAGVDYDGDGLTLADEHAAWVRYGDSKFPLNYSDGTQTSGGPVAVSPGGEWADINGDGFLTDDEKDIDGDGLTNWDEEHGRMTPDWWTAIWDTERAFTVTFLKTSWLDGDTDGDGLADGADDVDHDGYSNASEVNRGPYWVHPFNPCLPDPTSRTCPKHPPAKDSYPPFADPGWVPGEAIPLRWPR